MAEDMSRYDYQFVGAAKVTKVRDAIEAAGIEYEVAEVTLYDDGRYSMTITGQ